MRSKNNKIKNGLKLINKFKKLDLEIIKIGWIC